MTHRHQLFAVVLAVTIGAAAAQQLRYPMAFYYSADGSGQLNLASGQATRINAAALGGNVSLLGYASAGSPPAFTFVSTSANSSQLCTSALDARYWQPRVCCQLPFVFLPGFIDGYQDDQVFVYSFQPRYQNPHYYIVAAPSSFSDRCLVLQSGTLSPPPFGPMGWFASYTFALDGRRRRVHALAWSGVGAPLTLSSWQFDAQLAAPPQFTSQPLGVAAVWGQFLLAPAVDASGAVYLLAADAALERITLASFDPAAAAATPQQLAVWPIPSSRQGLTVELFLVDPAVRTLYAQWYLSSSVADVACAGPASYRHGVIAIDCTGKLPLLLPPPSSATWSPAVNSTACPMSCNNGTCADYTCTCDAGFAAPTRGPCLVCDPLKYCRSPAVCHASTDGPQCLPITT